jgi:Ogr/Delta-like zinc finger.
MRVYCQCGAVAHAPKHEQNGDSSDLHCVCSDPNCGHSFVQAVGYKHTLQHSKLELEQGAFVKQKRIFLWLRFPCADHQNEQTLAKLC